MTKKFTVCSLLFGEYTNLARRCLEPLSVLSSLGLINLRIGMNQVCQATKDYVSEKFKNAEYICEADPQLYKYPMMRKLFYDKPISTDYVMWFDDDSYIKNPDPVEWLSVVETGMKSCDMLGSVYVIPYGQDQKEWCKTQKWYTGKTIPDRPKFATGGWWTIKSSVLKFFDWPVPELKHCGGDVALGILFDQNSLKLKTFNTGIAINADETGKESAAARRGASRTEKPIGRGFVPGSR